MQAYDQAVVSASKIISQAIISDLDCVIVDILPAVNDGDSY